ncbi:PhoPQ-regulated protein [Serratia sp. Leaf50]|nr:PhoPQ-regulated protein [Serratia sp. Leaf50]
MKTLNLLLAFTALTAGHVYAQQAPVAAGCNRDNSNAPSQVISCYRQQLAAMPLNYALVSTEMFENVEIRKYQMISQSWSPESLVSPAQWKEDVTIGIPRSPKSPKALIAVDISDDSLLKVVQQTNTIVISLKTIPTRDLVYQQDNKPLEEDDSIARTWKLYAEHPAKRQQLPLQIPMTATISQTIRLAKKELVRWHIDKFIVAGASKRGWATWLTAISDPNVVAVVPFVIDVLNTKSAILNMYKTYGGNWPIAFAPYYNQGIDRLVNNPDFLKMLNIIDPMQYVGTRAQSGLAIPKYIVNASGDDFFPPDNSRFYYEKLPGIKSLRIAPNTGHIGIQDYIQQSLIAFINRLQDGRPLPVITTAPYRQSNSQNLTVHFSEKPQKVLRWTATNSAARDFRFACGITYAPTPLSVKAGNNVSTSLNYNGPGWQATFVEATFTDGYVATTQVYITPDSQYPKVAPPSNDAGCQTLPGR